MFKIYSVNNIPYVRNLVAIQIQLKQYWQLAKGTALKGGNVIVL